MKKKITGIMILLFISSIGLLTYTATENLIIRVGYTGGGENQNVGTVRIYESEETLESIQEGDVFTIFLENAEFMSPPSLIERGRFDLNVFSGGEDGDTYITYEFVDPEDPQRSGQVIIDFVLDNMRVLGGDISARVDSVQGGVSSGYFRQPNTEEPEENDEITEETVTITSAQIKEALNRKVDIVLNHNNYQIILPNIFLNQQVITEIAENQYDLRISVKKDETSVNSHLDDLYQLSFEILDENESLIKKVEAFDQELMFKLTDSNILDKRNTRGAIINDETVLLPSHYDQEKDQIMIWVSDFRNPLTIVRAANMRDLVFLKDINYVVQNGSDYIPLRYLANNLEWEITWNPFTRTVFLKKDEKEIEVSDYIIIRERSYVTTEFIKENFEVPLFKMDNQIVIK